MTERVSTCLVADPETASEADYDALQGYFTNRVVEFLLAHGKTPIVWNEAAWGKNLDPRIVVQYWVSDRDQSLAVHVGKGGKVLYSPMPSCYCDYPYGFITMQKFHDIDLLPADLIGKGPGFPMPNQRQSQPFSFFSGVGRSSSPSKPGYWSVAHCDAPPGLEPATRCDVAAQDARETAVHAARTRNLKDSFFISSRYCTINQ